MNRLVLPTLELRCNGPRRLCNHLAKCTRNANPPHFYSFQILKKYLSHPLCLQKKCLRKKSVYQNWKLGCPTIAVSSSTFTSQKIHCSLPTTVEKNKRIWWEWLQKKLELNFKLRINVKLKLTKKTSIQKVHEYSHVVCTCRRLN